MVAIDPRHLAARMSLDVLRRNNVRVLRRGGQPMLLAHGFGGDQSTWRHLVPHFADAYRVVLMDHVGAGGSDAAAWDPARYDTLEGYAQDVLEVAHALRLRDVVFVGHSVSGMVGVLAANREPERFARLVLIGPSPRYVDDPPYVGGFARPQVDGLLAQLAEDFDGWAESLAPVFVGRPDRPEVGAELAARLRATDRAMATHFARTTFYTDNRADLPHVLVPSLILQSARDVVAPPVVGEYLRRTMPGSTLRVMRATGHFPHESDPGETAELMREFLRGPVEA